MSKYLASFGAVPIDFVKGEGAYLFDRKGKKYLDFLGGWCVSTVGWKNPEMAAALARQAILTRNPSRLYANSRTSDDSQRPPHAMVTRRLDSSSYRARLLS